MSRDYRGGRSTREGADRQDGNRPSGRHHGTDGGRHQRRQDQPSKHRSVSRKREPMECGEHGMVSATTNERPKNLYELGAKDVVDLTRQVEVDIPSRIGKQLTGHRGSVTKAHFTRDGLHLMSCGQDRTIRLWNPYTGLQIQEFSGPHNKEISDVSIFRDKSKFVSVGGDVNAFLWDVSNKKVVRKFQDHSSKIYCSWLGYGDDLLFTGSDDRKVNIWDMRQKGRPIQSLGDARDSITALYYREDVSRLMSSSVDGNLREYDLRNGALIETQFSHPITSIAISSNNDACAVALLDGSIRLIDLMARNNQVNAFTTQTPSVYRHQVSFDPSDTKILIGTQNGKLLGWEIDTDHPSDATTYSTTEGNVPLFHVEFAPERPVTDLGVRVSQQSPYPAYVTCSMDSTMQVYFDEMDDDTPRVIGI